MHFSLSSQAFGLGVFAFLVGWLVLIVRVAQIRWRNRVPFGRAVQLAVRHGISGPGSVIAILLGLALIAAPAFNSPAPEAAVSSFLPPQAGPVQDEPGDEPWNHADWMTVAVTETAPAGPAVSLNPSMSTDALQHAIDRAPRGASVVFAAGKYNVANTIIIPCNALHLTGPAGTPPAAILSANFRNSDIFAFKPGCEEPGSIRYLHFANTGAVYFAAGDNGNFTFEHNLITNLPSGLSNGGSETGLFFDGSMDTHLRNVLVRYNTFGDAQSCTAVFATPKDEGGYCSGIVTSQREVNNIRIEYNKFFHIENGVHFNQLAQWAPGQPNSVCISCVVDYNYIANYHRIGIEIQTSTPTDSILIEHNAIVDPIASSWGTFAVSMACCQWGHNFGTLGASPGYIFNDNVLVATLPIGSECPPYGVEFWGHGSQGMNSLVQGTFCNGYTWGYGAEPWAIHHNYICGPNLEGKGGYISDQQKQGNPPKQTDNLMAPKCAATPSTAPTISPASKSFTGTQLVTLSDKGLNTGIWYTTDGSNPVPGAGTAKYYTGPFSVTSSTTVKALGMWGSENEPLSYPPGYGYIPSNVINASYTVSTSSNQAQSRADAGRRSKNSGNV